MKLSEVYQKYGWQRIRMFDDVDHPTRCCLLGACLLADNIPCLGEDYVKFGQEYLLVMEASETARQLTTFIQQNRHRLGCINPLDAGFIHGFNDNNYDFTKIDRLIKEFEGQDVAEETTI